MWINFRPWKSAFIGHWPPPLVMTAKVSVGGYAQAYRQNANNYGYRNNARYGRDGYYDRDSSRTDQYRQHGNNDRRWDFPRY